MAKSKTVAAVLATAAVAGMIPMLNTTAGVIMVPINGGAAVQMAPPGVPVNVPEDTAEHPDIAVLADNGSLLFGEDAEAHANKAAVAAMSELRNKSILQPKETRLPVANKAA